MENVPNPRVSSHAVVSSTDVRTQMERILASEIFARSERLSSFFRFIVERTLDGNGHTLKELVIAQDVFGRSDFDSAADPIVRVEARRLRDKLREYYAGTNGDPVLITVPKGSYVPAFERKQSVIRVTEPRQHFPVPRSRGWRLQVTLPVALLVAVLAVTAARYGFRSHSPTPARIRRLTSLPGNESSASLSPDGNFVVFSSSNDGPEDLYIKAVDNESMRRLTETSEPELSPAWSPDGAEIAFVRGGKGVFIVAAVGGVERKIADSGARVRWSSNSKSVFVGDMCPGAFMGSCVYQIALDSLDKRQITNATDFIALDFAASPDGQTLAVVGQKLRPVIADIYLVALAGGPACRLTTWNRFVNGIAWTPDGKYLFYSLLQQGRFALWRMVASGTEGPGERVADLGESAVMPTVALGSSGQVRVAYHTVLEDVSLTVVELNPTGPAAPVGAGVRVADATEGRDCGARFSPDAQQIAFSSFRSGEGLFWLVGRDGASLRPLMPVVAQEAWTRGAQEGVLGAWSPDGRSLALDLVVGDNSDIYVTDSSGIRPLRLTTEPSLDVTPNWSPNGRWIYFASDRSGSFQLWRIPADGGQPTQVTFQGGFEPRPSVDGRYIYYMADLPGASRPNVLKRVPPDGGEESAILEGIAPFHWAVTENGIYLLTLEEGRDYLDRYDPNTGRRTRLGMLPFQVARGFCESYSVSRDGRFLVANHVDRYEMNLGLIDGFR